MSDDNSLDRQLQISRICGWLRPDYEKNLYTVDWTKTVENGAEYHRSMIYDLPGMTEQERSVFVTQITELFDGAIWPYMTFRK